MNRGKMAIAKIKWGHDTQHNEIQPNNTQYNDIQHTNKYIVTLSTITFSIMAEIHYAECR